MASAVCALAILTCARETAGPGARGMLAVGPTFPQTLSLAAFNLTIDNVRLIVVRPPADVVFDKTFAFAAQDTSVQLSADVPLEQSPETFQVTIEMLSGATLLFSGTQDVEVSADQGSPPAQIPVTYSGPGQNVATLTITPLDSVLSFGGEVTFQATARDGQGAIVPNFYVAWATDDSPRRISGPAWSSLPVRRAPPASRTVSPLPRRSPSSRCRPP
jgi:hypothetical protein